MEENWEGKEKAEEEGNEEDETKKRILGIEEEKQNETFR